MNYKKNILSLVTIMALSNTVMADSTAKYLPLTSDTVDSSWVLFGVNGFSTGVPTTVAVAASSFSTGFTELEDTVANDALATSGLGGLVSLQGLADDAALTVISVGIDVSSYTYDATEAVRTMYVKFGESYPSMKLDYKASLEGAVVEVYYNNTTFYHFTITQAGTWANAVQALDGLTTGSSNNGSSSDVKAIASVIDFDFRNNPVNPADYNGSLQTLGGDRDLPATTALGAAHFYHFNAINQQWEVWNRHAVAAANDFTDFSVGQAYWGRMDRVDVDGALVKDNVTKRAGLVLGDAAGTAGQDIYKKADDNSSILTEGWNMLAFNEVQPYVRHSATGLVLTGIVVTDQITLTDSSGLYSVTSALPAAVTAAGMGTFSIAFNKQIESLKLRGLLPKTFNVKVFGTGTASELVIVSDNKFYVDAPIAGTIAVTTLTGGNPYVDGVKAAVADLEVASTAVTSVESVYGEYSLMLDVLTGAGTASQLDSTVVGAGANLSAKVMFGRSGVDSTTGAIGLAANNTATTLSTAKAIFDAEAVLNGTDASVVSVGRTLLVDTTFDGTADMMIASSTNQFYVKDNTYTRVFTYNTAASVAGTDAITVSGTNTVTVDPTAATVANVVGLINAQADALALTGVYASEGVTTPAATLVVVTTGNDTFDLKDAPSATIDFLTAGAESDKIAQGAIAGAYALDTLARKSVNQVSDTVTEFSTDTVVDSILNTVSDDWSVQVNAIVAVTRNASTTYVGTAGSVNLITTYGELETMYDEMVAVLNEICIANTLHCSASHDFTIPSGSTAATLLTNTTTYTDGTITLTGVDVTALNIAIVDNAVLGNPVQPTHVAATGTNNVTIGSGDLMADVKSNAVYTPNYAVYGPLYTLKNAGTGYDVRAVLKATTDMDIVTSPISWDSIDITRHEDEWFANNEFNLFNIDSQSGYWAYLTPKSTSGIVIGTPTFTPTYTYYFNNSGTSPAYLTSNLINGGSLEVTVTGLGTSTASSVYAIIGAEEIPLKRTAAGSTQYTADISTYALKNFVATGAPIPVDIRAVDGKGAATLSSAIISIDYTKPNAVTASTSTATGATFTTTSTDAAKIYVFNGYIPEVSPENSIFMQQNAIAGATTLDMCSNVTFGTTAGLRVVAADGTGTIGSSNISNALNYNYAGTLKGAHVLTNTPGDTAATETIGTLYSSSCVASAATTNSGVRLSSLVSGVTASMSFVPVTGEAFGQDVSWTSSYQISGNTDIIQIQATAAYVGDTFYVEYNGALYTQVFPTEANAGLSISGNPITLTAVTASNITLIP